MKSRKEEVKKGKYLVTSWFDLTITRDIEATSAEEAILLFDEWERKASKEEKDEHTDIQKAMRMTIYTPDGERLELDDVAEYDARCEAENEKGEENG